MGLDKVPVPFWKQVQVKVRSRKTEGHCVYSSFIIIVLVEVNKITHTLHTTQYTNDNIINTVWLLKALKTFTLNPSQMFNEKKLIRQMTLKRQAVKQVPHTLNTCIKWIKSISRLQVSATLSNCFSGFPEMHGHSKASVPKALPKN